MRLVREAPAGGGLDTAEVDARVAAGVLDWAETGNTDAIPAAKLTNVPAPTLPNSVVQTFGVMTADTLRVSTQAAYNALPVKDANTLYLIPS